MVLRINGEEAVFDDGLSVAALLEKLGIKSAGAAVELNKEVVPRGLHAETVLKDNDTVEIIRAFGGG